MSFWQWHYSQGLQYYLDRWRKSLKQTWHFFSVPVLVRTLLAPWKRAQQKTKPGFSVENVVDTIGFNLASRWVGFLVRAALIIFAVIAVGVLCVVGAGGLVMWLTVPWLGRPVYKKILKDPGLVATELAAKMTQTADPLKVMWATPAGQFVLEHVGVTVETMLASNVASTGVNQNEKYEGFFHLLSVIFDSGVWPDEWWRHAEVRKDDLLLAAQIWDSRQRQEARLGEDESAVVARGIGVELLYGYTPTLDKFGSELRLSGERGELIGRDSVVERLVRIVEGKGVAMVIGVPGVGKGAVMRELAYRLDRKYLRVIEVTMGIILAGAAGIDEKKRIVRAIFSEASAAGNVVLVVKDLARIVNAAAEGVDLTDVVEEQLEKKKLAIIALATPEEYEKFIVPNSRVVKNLERVEVAALDAESATRVLLNKAALLESKTGMVVTIPALKRIVQAGQRYFSDVPFPKIALELLDGLASYSKHIKKRIMTPQEVEEVVAEKTGIPLTAMSGTDKKKLANIEGIMKERLVGQHTALDLIGRSLRSRVMGMGSDSKPVGTFLFLGPTGVGKTETAKVLSDAYFGHTNIMRFDMAEYVGVEGLTKLIGSTTLNQPGILTTAIKRNPAGMLLLDELEKASSEVFNALLTILDEGYINDAFGRKVDCRNMFVIATSNAGSEYIRGRVAAGVAGEQLQREVLEFVLRERIFAPEFLNRFDGVVVYEPLQQEHLVDIAKLQLVDLKRKVLERNNIYVEIHDEVFYKLASDGYDPLFGARPMKRAVDLVIGDLLSRAILSEEMRAGDRVWLKPGSGKHEYNWGK